MGETLFRYRVSEGRLHFSKGENLHVFGGETLFRDTDALVRIPVNTLKLYPFQNIGHSAHHWVYNCNSFLMRRKGGFHTATRLQMRINVNNVVKHYNYTYNYKLFVERCFEDRPTQDSGNKVIVHYSSIQAYVTVGYITISQVSHSNITFTFTLP